MKNIIIKYKKYLFLTFIFSVFLAFGADAQIIDEQENTPVTPSAGSSMATSTVDGDKLVSRPSIDAANTLYGRLNGLTVLQNTTYGDIGEGSPTMYIRGIGSLANHSMLVLVDGIERPVSSLVTEEIENVTILKDAVALALYGMRGANGVLLVTTKRGHVGGTKINVSYQHGFTSPTRLPAFANAAAYAGAVNEGLANEGLAPRYSSAELNAYANQNHPYLFPDVNWMDETLRSMGHRDHLNFSARGGNNNATYFSLINLMTDRGLVKETNLYEDYHTQLTGTSLNVRTNLDVNVTSSTLMQVNVLGRITERSRPASQSAAEMMQNIYNLPSNAFPVRNQNGTWGIGSSTVFPDNPVAASSSTGYTTDHYRGMFADITLRQDLEVLVEGLNIEGKLAFDAGSMSRDVRDKIFLSESVVARFDANGQLGTPVTTIYGREVPELGFTSSTPSLHRFFNLSFKLNFERESETTKFTSFLKYSQDKKSINTQYATVLHQDITAFGQYALNNRYYFDVALSYSGSSNLPVDSQWGFFPAVGVAWRVSQENFLQSAAWLDDMKVRASFGLTGNSGITYNLDQYPFISSTNVFYFRNFTGFPGRREGHLPGIGVTHEKTQMFNIGLDAQLIGKLSFNADFFSNKTYDIMVSRAGTFSSIVGATHAYEATGEVKNSGIELGLSYGDNTGDFKYNIGAQFSFVRNEIVNMNEEPRPYNHLKETGKPVGQMFGLEVEGFFRDHADISQSPVQAFSQVFPGDFKYKNQTPDNRIDHNDMVAIGFSDMLPEIYYSATIDFEYKGIGLSALFQGVGNYSTYLNTPGLFFPLVGNGNISEHYLDDYWSGPSDVNAKYPRLSATESHNNYRPNSVFIADASYLKLRYAELYYRFPVARFGMEDVKLFLRGTDLFSIDSIKVTDPEATGAVYPALKTFHLGFSIMF